MAQENGIGIREASSNTSRYKQAEIVQLESGVASLRSGQVAVRMIEGVAWITRNNQDIFVYPEQEVVLSKSEYPVLISALHRKQRIVFEVNPR